MPRRTTAMMLAVVPVFLLVSACSGGGGSGPAATDRSSPPAVGTSGTPTAAAQRQPHILVFTATGDAAVDSVTYVVDGKSVTASPASLPWRVSLPLPADGAMHNYEVTINVHHGSVQILAILDGTTRSSSNWSGDTGQAQLSGGIAG
ncbi:MAG: hypothetical protein ACJ73S_09415 [Mycobacteriales bacterium]